MSNANSLLRPAQILRSIFKPAARQMLLRVIFPRNEGSASSKPAGNLAQIKGCPRWEVDEALLIR